MHHRFRFSPSYRRERPVQPASSTPRNTAPTADKPRERAPHREPDVRLADSVRPRADAGKRDDRDLQHERDAVRAGQRRAQREDVPDAGRDEQLRRRATRSSRTGARRCAAPPGTSFRSPGTSPASVSWPPTHTVAAMTCRKSRIVCGRDGEHCNQPSARNTAVGRERRTESASATRSRTTSPADAIS